MLHHVVTRPNYDRASSVDEHPIRMEPALPSEIEIKLDLSSEALESLLGSDLLGQPDEALQQSSTYFETDDRRLSEKGVLSACPLYRRVPRPDCEGIRAGEITVCSFRMGDVH
ncbi:hypothetical protein LZK76_32730 (plasmid) [Rhizobium leguminosarum]|nr:hypothetical protein LZK76_32730 [Rhizobium leguminosarum]